MNDADGTTRLGAVPKWLSWSSFAVAEMLAYLVAFVFMPNSRTAMIIFVIINIPGIVAFPILEIPVIAAGLVVDLPTDTNLSWIPALGVVAIQAVLIYWTRRRIGVALRKWRRK